MLVKHAQSPLNWVIWLLNSEINMISREYLDMYCHSVRCVWELDSNKRRIRVARYVVKGLFNPVASMKWVVALNKWPQLYLWFSNNPRLLLKPSRHYINRTYNFELRTQVILNHYAMLLRYLSIHSFEALAKGNPLLLATLEGKRGQSYQITLEKTGKFDREGELVLQLSQFIEGLSIFRFVFSLNIYGHQTGIEIGCIQGPKGEDACEIIKRATKDLHGIRPKNLLADAMYALAAVWNLTELFGVCNRSRVYQDKHTHADYDSFWMELGSKFSTNGMFRLPNTLHHHQLSEIKSHHRSEYKQRMNLRDSLGTQVTKAASNYGS
jgi:uncharacterized protein VirK/YbjX